MSASTIPPCPLGLSSDDLSAWRDHTPAPADERRITDHINTCPACQRTVAAHEALASALRAEQTPTPDPRNWPQLQARITSANGPRRAIRRSATRSTQRTALWGGLGAVAAVLLISALFFRLFEQRAALRGATSAAATVITTPSALSTVAPTRPIAGPTLDWQIRMIPASVIPLPGNRTYTNFAFSPTDARTIYTCDTTNAATAPTITVWATHDGAVSWTRVSDLPSGGKVTQCYVTVDAADPMRVIISMSEQNASTYQSSVTNALSDDGGRTWRMIGSNMAFNGLDTRRGNSISVVSTTTNSDNPNDPRHRHLSLSRDNWKTFQAIDGPLAARGLVVSRAWRRPGDGALLAEAVQQVASRGNPATPAPSAVPNGPPATTLWQSADLGEHWTQLPTPPNMLTANNILVAQPVANEPWKACGFIQTGSGAALSQLIGCTLDGGRTWQSRPLPALKQSCGSACMQQQIVGWNFGALLHDGSLVASFYTGPANPNTGQPLGMVHIFLLPSDATQWQDLGSWPGNPATVIESAPAGTLVSYRDGYYTASPGDHSTGDIPFSGALAFATLP